MADDNREHTYLLSKIESIESRLDGHVVKIEQKLDQIVHIMQAVASLQEKESRNADSIKELKSTLKESVEKFDKTISRIHSRLDELETIAKTDKDTQAAKCSLSDAKIVAVDEKVSKWMNRGIGLWIGISALVIVLQTGGALFINSITNEYQATKTQMADIGKRQNEIEQDIVRINSTMRNLHPANK